MSKKIPVTEFAKMGYCETQLVLNKKHKNEGQSYRDQAAISRGNKEHDAFDARVKKQHIPYQAANDKRCFVASCVYGQEHPKTERLRRFRDRSLLPTSTGRALVKLYYSVSPKVLPLLEKHRVLKRITTYLLNAIVRRLPCN